MNLTDITVLDTFKHVPEWVQIIRENAGDKVDLEEDREVSKEEGIKFAKKYNLSAFIEISTKTGKNVEEVFEVLARLMISQIKTP